MSIFTCTVMMLLSMSDDWEKDDYDDFENLLTRPLLTISEEDKTKVSQALERIRQIQQFSELMNNKVEKRKAEIANITAETTEFFQHQVKKLSHEVQVLQLDLLKNKYANWIEFQSKKKEYEKSLAIYEQKTKQDQEFWRDLSHDYEISKVSKIVLLDEMNNVFEMIKEIINSHEEIIADPKSEICDFYHKQLKQMSYKLEELKLDINKNYYENWDKYTSEKESYQSIALFYDKKVKEICESKKELANNYENELILDAKMVDVENKYVDKTK